MPTGLDHVHDTVAACERLREGLATLDGAPDAAARLETMQASLIAMQERFFLRSKLCLPFAARCAKEAAALELALAAVRASEPEAAQRFEAGLEALDRAVKVLDDRSNAQGMVIT
jgi:hypothetical protein